MKYITEFSQEIMVEFENSAAAQKYFLDDNDWQSSFWDLDNMKDLSESIAHGFNATPSSWNCERKAFTRFIEGFGLFEEVVKNGKPIWVCKQDAKNGGDITIVETEELYIVDSREVER